MLQPSSLQSAIHFKSFSKTTTRDAEKSQNSTHKMDWDWVRWAAASILGVRTHHEMEAEGAPPEPQVALAPASVPVPAIVPGNTFDINIPLRVPRTEKGRYVTKGNRLLRIRDLNSEMHESAFQSSKSIIVECMTSKCTGKFRLITYISYIITI